jgi:hypothetical protein
VRLDCSARCDGDVRSESGPCCVCVLEEPVGAWSVLRTVHPDGVADDERYATRHQQAPTTAEGGPRLGFVKDYNELSTEMAAMRDGQPTVLLAPDR